MGIKDILSKIDLNTVGAAVKGMDEASTEINDRRFALRAKELAAKQNSLISRKNASYEIDLKAYAKEKTKADDITSLNAEGDIGSYNYATKWLSLTDKNFKDYDKTQQNSMISTLMTSMAKNKDAAGNILSKNYVATGESKEALEARYAANEATIMKIIGDETIKQSEKNFLIDKIVGIKDEDTDIDAQIAAALKAEKKVEDVTNSTLTKTTALTEDKLPSTIDSKEFQAYSKAFDTHRKEITFKSVDDKNNAIDFLTTSNWLRADKGDYYKIDDSGKITDSTPAARALMKTYKDTYTYVLNKMKVENYYSQDKNIGNIGSIFNSNEVHDFTQNLLLGRAVNMDRTGWFDGKKDMKVIAMVPVKVMDLENTIDFGDGKKKVDSQKVKTEYENFLRLVADEEMYQSDILRTLNNDADIVKAVQGNLENGGQYTTILKDYLKDKDIYIKEEVKDETKDGVTTETTTIEEDKTKPIDTNTWKSTTVDGKVALIAPTTDGNWKAGDKIVLTPKTIEILKASGDETLIKAIMEATKYGLDTKDMAPRGPQKYLDEPGKRGVKQINPAWQKIQDLEKSLTSVKPKKVTKQKVR